MPTQTSRKLIKFGQGEVVMTVPKGWVRYHNLKAGDRLEVIVDGDLVLRPERTAEKTPR
jgi:AbrB family looped-hinge helix DNA binding protein